MNDKDAIIEKMARELEPIAWAALGTGDTRAFAKRRASSLKRAGIIYDDNIVIRLAYEAQYNENRRGAD